MRLMDLSINRKSFSFCLLLFVFFLIPYLIYG
nr:MAG TPA: coiled-coil domain-containing protein [Caudoviricetes sp.]